MGSQTSGENERSEHRTARPEDDGATPLPDDRAEYPWDAYVRGEVHEAGLGVPSCSLGSVHGPMVGPVGRKRIEARACLRTWQHGTALMLWAGGDLWEDLWLEMRSDANFAAPCSEGGYCIFLVGDKGTELPLEWRSHKQRLTATSSAESELMEV